MPNRAIDAWLEVFENRQTNKIDNTAYLGQQSQKNKQENDSYNV